MTLVRLTETGRSDFPRPGGAGQSALGGMDCSTPCGAYGDAPATMHLLKNFPWLGAHIDAFC
jgi:hypothetical protein